jgi:hypothetical protein
MNRNLAAVMQQCPRPDGSYSSKSILPEAKRWFLVGCFITLSKDKSINQLDKIN